MMLKVWKTTVIRPPPLQPFSMIMRAPVPTHARKRCIALNQWLRHVTAVLKKFAAHLNENVQSFFVQRQARLSHDMFSLPRNVFFSRVAEPLSSAVSNVDDNS